MNDRVASIICQLCKDGVAEGKHDCSNFQVANKQNKFQSPNICRGCETNKTHCNGTDCDSCTCRVASPICNNCGLPKHGFYPPPEGYCKRISCLKRECPKCGHITYGGFTLCQKCKMKNKGAVKMNECEELQVTNTECNCFGEGICIQELRNSNTNNKYELIIEKSIERVRGRIVLCQGSNHIQQVAYSTYHDALTQVCFGCQAVRTNMMRDEL